MACFRSQFILLCLGLSLIISVSTHLSESMFSKSYSGTVKPTFVEFSETSKVMFLKFSSLWLLWCTPDKPPIIHRYPSLSHNAHSQTKHSLPVVIVHLNNINNWPYLRINNFTSSRYNCHVTLTTKFDPVLSELSESR